MPIAPSVVAATAFVALFAAAGAHAQGTLFRAYLSTSGSDANSCQLAAPCRLLPRALAVVQDGGEIWLLDSGNYNASQVDIGKGVTVVSMPGVQGSLVAAGTNAQAAVVLTTAPVTFRNVTFLPLPGIGTTGGVLKTGSGALTFQDCNLSGFSTFGISVGSGANLTVLRSVLREMDFGIKVQGAGSVGVSESTFIDTNTGIQSLAGGASTARILVARSVMRLVNVGVDAQADFAGSKAVVQVSDSVIEGITPPSQLPAGISAVAVTGATAELAVAGSRISRFGRGILLSGPAPSLGMFSGNLVTGNVTGLLVTGSPAAVHSGGNNIIKGNSIDVNSSIAVTTTNQ